MQNGNFSSWEENKRRQDVHAKKENEKHRKEIAKLEKAARQAGQWSDQVEKSKIGQKEAGTKLDRGYVGHKAAKMMKRAEDAGEKKKKRGSSGKRRAFKRRGDADRAENGASCSSQGSVGQNGRLWT